MQRYFVKDKKAEEFILYDQDKHHIKKVMRNKIGDNIEEVAEGALTNCDNLKYIVFGKNVKTIKQTTFLNVLDEIKSRNFIIIRILRFFLFYYKTAFCTSQNSTCTIYRHKIMIAS